MATPKTRGAAKRGRGRPKVNTVEWIAFSSRMRADQDRALAEITAETGIPRTRLLEDALTMFLESYDRRRKVE